MFCRLSRMFHVKHSGQSLFHVKQSWRTANALYKLFLSGGSAAAAKALQIFFSRPLVRTPLRWYNGFSNRNRISHT